MRTRLVPLVLLLAASILPAAPAPRPRPPPPALQVTAGRYTLMWAQQKWAFILASDGACRCWSESQKGLEWEGVWTWHATSRTLRVKETCGRGGTWARWRVTLDAGLRGVATHDTQRGIRMRMERRK